MCNYVIFLFGKKCVILRKAITITSMYFTLDNDKDKLLKPILINISRIC